MPTTISIAIASHWWIGGQRQRLQNWYEFCKLHLLLSLSIYFFRKILFCYRKWMRHKSRGILLSLKLQTQRKYFSLSSLLFHISWISASITFLEFSFSYSTFLYISINLHEYTYKFETCNFINYAFILSYKVILCFAIDSPWHTKMSILTII